MRLYMRNKATGEIKDVEAESPEFYELKEQVTPQGLTMWEQTNVPHAEAIKERATHGELLEEDLGHEDQAAIRHEALRLNAEGVAPEANPHLNLTPGEIEAGMTPASKLEDLRAEFEEKSVTERHQILDRAADRIADEREDRGTSQPAKGQLARAGGSDDRVNVPSVEASDDDKGTPSKGSKTGARSQSQSPAAQVAASESSSKGSGSSGGDS